MSWFIVDAFSDLDSQHRVATETIEVDVSDEALVRMAEQYPKARTFRCLEVREQIAQRLTEDSMTTHRIDEPIALVKLSPNTVRHIRRPRSQKGVAYCGTFLAMASAEGLELVIQDPTNIPLEIDLERDFEGLCRKCARTFVQEVAAAYPNLLWYPGIEHAFQTVPQVWVLIHARTGRHSPPLKIREDRDGFDSVDPPDQLEDPRETRAFGEAITAEEDAVAADDSLERSEERDT